MRLSACLLAAASLLTLQTSPVSAQDRYRAAPPVVVSPDLAAPWVLQLGKKPGKVVQRKTAQPVEVRNSQQRIAVRRETVPGVVLVQPQGTDRTVVTSSVARPPKKQVQQQMDPKFLPREVDYETGHKPGTIVIDSASKYLYLVMENGTARRYGVGVGKEGMGWKGVEHVTRKAVWPEWRPPAQMIARERKKGRILPSYMAGGEANPLGARALYLGSTLYRIHGTNAPWTIGTSASSGCIRMRNQDVIELYEMVKVGAKVVVM
ncbi:MAG: L,D-transpeptidase [Rhizobiaceae bacterium]|nr:L,D-transpeptidase [Rhizobiaceae bacterium]